MLSSDHSMVAPDRPAINEKIATAVPAYLTKRDRLEGLVVANNQRPKLPQFFFSMSFCTSLPISIKRRQTFSRNEITLSTSASLGSLSSGSLGFVPD